MVKLGINGFGRIGRLVLRASMTREDVGVVAVNSRGGPRNLAYLFKYDSVHGPYNGTVDHTEGALVVDGTEIPVLCEDDPADIRWDLLGATIVAECTGGFTDFQSASRHLEGGAEHVVITAPAKGDVRVPVRVIVRSCGSGGRQIQA